MKYNISAQLAMANIFAKMFWEKAQRRFGAKVGKIPTLKMNARLTSTAGRAWLETNLVDLSCYLFHNNVEYFQKDTIPHELCHHIAYRLYGSKGHDKAWYYVMQELGVEGGRCHSMMTLSQAKKRGLVK